MLKSRDRTEEISVMEMEEWSQVDCNKLTSFNRNKDYEYDKKVSLNS